MRSRLPIIILLVVFARELVPQVESVSSLPQASAAQLGRVYRWTGATTADICPHAGAGGSGGNAVAFCVTLDGTQWRPVPVTDGTTQTPVPEFISVKDRGAKGDCRTVYDASIGNGSSTLHSNSAVFTMSDIGKIGIVHKWDAAFHWYSVTITGYLGPHDITVTRSPYDFAGAEFQWGTDDRTAVTNALNSMDRGGTLYFPPGVYMLSSDGVPVTKSNVTFRGFNNRASVLTSNAHSQILRSNYPPSALVTGVTIEDLGFDGHWATVNQILLIGGVTKDFVINRNRFIRAGAQSLGVSTPNLRIVNNEFDGYGMLTSTAVALSLGASNVTITANTFRYVNSGIGGSAPSLYALSNITIDSNYFDLGWNLGKTAYTNGGRTVVYTASALRDNAGMFPLLRQFTPIRVLGVRISGTATVVDGGLTQIHDPSADYGAAGVQAGDLVKMDGAVGVVLSVLDSTHLQIEEWLTDDFRQPAQPTYGPYTIRKMAIGRYVRAGSSSTVLNTLDGWHDWFGNAVTPPNGTLYEVQVGPGNYPIHFEKGAEKVIITNNTVKRGYADQISYYGSYGVIRNNTVTDGQDMGITLNGHHQNVGGNTIYHNGAGGIWANANDSVVSGNTITASTWMNFQNSRSLGEIILPESVTGVVVSDNICDGLSNAPPWSETIHRYGITLVSFHGSLSGNSIHGNKLRNHTVADIRLDGSGVANNDIWGNTGSISAVNGATYTTPWDKK